MNDIHIEKPEHHNIWMSLFAGVEDEHSDKYYQELPDFDVELFAEHFLERDVSALWPAV